jgi:hypothetical protein
MLLLALVLLAGGVVRFDVFSAWLHEHVDPWWQRLHHH